MVKGMLAHPLTQGLKVDDPLTTETRRQIIRRKVFLTKIYKEWYAAITSSLPVGTGAILEIGSGAGFLKDTLPEVVTSEVFYCPHVDIVMDGCQMPFMEGALRAIVMIDVLHHLPRPRFFFKEATRCIRSGGILVMIEPWVTWWSRWVYKRFHHEPFRPEAAKWEFSSKGPLSGANSALPWIVFQRDWAQFKSEFPQWQMRSLKLMMPFRYIVSGGISLRNLQPGWSYALWSTLEYALQPFMPKLAMFAHIVLQKIGDRWNQLSNCQDRRGNDD
jgi:SAM-dependent methyltransferase